MEIGSTLTNTKALPAASNCIVRRANASRPLGSYNIARKVPRPSQAKVSRMNNSLVDYARRSHRWTDFPDSSAGIVIDYYA